MEIVVSRQWPVVSGQATDFGVNNWPLATGHWPLFPEEGRMKKELSNMRKHYLLASDFEQTVSFNDSGIILRELMGRDRFMEAAHV